MSLEEVVKYDRILRHEKRDGEWVEIRCIDWDYNTVKITRVLHLGFYDQSLYEKIQRQKKTLKAWSIPRAFA